MKRHSSFPVRATLFAALVLLISLQGPPPAEAQTAAAPPAPRNAYAVLRDAAGREAGRASFAPAASGDGVQLTLEASGLTPGAHGFHVHKNGECAPGPDAATGQVVPFGAAGGHFDPMQTMKHGGPDHPPEHVHAGDLPNLQAGADGRARLDLTTPRVSTAPGKLSVIGRTIVVHEKADDHQTNPAGNSGGRVLCGLIEPGTPGAASPISARHVLPGANTFPEGIALHASGVAYVGSSSEGHLYKIDPATQKAEVLSWGGSPGRQSALGLRLDAFERLWVAGGAQGTVALVDRRDGRTLRVLKTPPSPAAYINDIAVAAGGLVYVTDSARPVVFRARNVENESLIAPDLEPWLDLTKSPIRYGAGINLNGIVASPDGRLLLAVQSNTGQVWRIDTRTKAISEVKLAQPLKNGDGLVLDGKHLHVLRNAEGEIATVALGRGWHDGKIVQRLADPRLRYPTTAAWAGDGLWVVNGQLDKRREPPPVLPFDVVKVVVGGR